MIRLRPTLVLLAFALVTLPLMPVQQVFVWVWPAMARRFPMHYHRIVCRILGIRVKVIGAPTVTGPTLIASNHVSWLDIMVLSAVAPLSFIAKREVGGWAFFVSFSPGQQGFTATAFHKAILWALFYELTGFGCGSEIGRAHV